MKAVPVIGGAQKHGSLVLRLATPRHGAARADAGRLRRTAGPAGRGPLQDGAEEGFSSWISCHVGQVCLKCQHVCMIIYIYKYIYIDR